VGSGVDAVAAANVSSGDPRSGRRAGEVGAGGRSRGRRVGYVRQEWQFALQDDKVVTPVLRLAEYPDVPEELRLFHADDFRDDARFDFHHDNLVRQLSEPVQPLPAHYLARVDCLSGSGKHAQKQHHV
jgi:hypothetical protein